MDKRARTIACENQSVGALYLIGQMINNLLSLSTGRHLIPVVVGGYMYLAGAVVASPMLVPYGMLVGIAVALILDEGADEQLKGPLNRDDHAALAAGLACLVHAFIVLVT